ncbi:putative Serine/threonine protein kinase [Waddlia chondrophila 2032/99]|uniref:Putative Serine/threonine protein kinase n=1 Tax=Waddlia chondrophila 2032/99 TaxID=765953 RepID=F8LEM3_9BACT|nr:putative Serine/threonine protein kinase [Waddlia chondrophila 2032/99]
MSLCENKQKQLIMHAQHPYNQHSKIYNFFFHPLHRKDEEKVKTILAVITNIFVTVISAGLWQIPFWIVNDRDRRKVTKWTQDQTPKVAKVQSNHFKTKKSDPKTPTAPIQRSQPTPPPKKSKRELVISRLKADMEAKGYNDKQILEVLKHGENLVKFLLETPDDQRDLQIHPNFGAEVKRSKLENPQSPTEFEEARQAKMLKLAVKTELLFKETALFTLLPNYVNSKKHGQKLAPHHRLFDSTKGLQAFNLSSMNQPLRKVHLIATKSLGSGNFNTTSSAFHMGLGREIALRELSQKSLLQPNDLSDWDREVRMYRALVNTVPGLVNLHDVSVINSTSPQNPQMWIPTERGLILEKCEGDLSQFIYKWDPQQHNFILKERLPNLESRGFIIAQIAHSLDALHTQGYSHGDLKADNVFYVKDKQGRVHTKIGDLGCVKPLGQRYRSDGHHGYQPPESAHLWSQYGAAADCWGLGLIAFELKYNSLLSEDLSTIIPERQLLYALLDCNFDPHVMAFIRTRDQNLGQWIQQQNPWIYQCICSSSFPFLANLMQSYSNCAGMNSQGFYTHLVNSLNNRYRAVLFQHFQRVGLCNNQGTYTPNDALDQAILSLLNLDPSKRMNAGQAKVLLSQAFKFDQRDLGSLPVSSKASYSGSLASIVPEMNQWLQNMMSKYPDSYAEGALEEILDALGNAENFNDFEDKLNEIQEDEFIDDQSKKYILMAVKNRLPRDLGSSGVPFGHAPLQTNGLSTGYTYQGFPVIHQDRRYTVRDQTKKNLMSLFGRIEQYDKGGQSKEKYKKDAKSVAKTSFDNPPGIREPIKGLLKHVRLYQDDRGACQSSNQEELLGRFDVVSVPCRIDYDAFWNPVDTKHQKIFYMHHAAALNIGETQHASDFKAYSNNGMLDESKYVKDMQSIFGNVLSAQSLSGVKHAVWFPFGMGAFLRNLHKCDPSYNDSQKLSDLRQSLAKAFVEELKKHPGMDIHLCLPVSGPGDESTENYNAFISALLAADSQVKSRVTVYTNQDATALAQELANKHGGDQVSLANGANRKLIGNHWFDDRALRAIDENIHRRSPISSAIALMLDQDVEPKKRKKDELKTTIQKFGGQIISL